ncbi:MAG: T9SS type A sorting domain-containing protein, partial [Bacteroidetes bacterium]|nr:T9SS type A sorting domain-containing protein [Bacteroidota bacterium]
DYLAQLRTQIDLLSADFNDFANLCYGLDAAYAISQTPGATADIFLLRVKGLRPRLTERMCDLLARAEIPVANFLYLTSPAAVPNLGSVPAALNAAGDAIFDPVHGIIKQKDNPLALFRRSATEETFSGGIIDDDRAFLSELRTRVEEANTGYIAENFDALRVSGKGMVAEIERMQRPMLGIAPDAMYAQEATRKDYYGVVARAQLLKSRRAVLSVALADYLLAPTVQKQTELVAEIDSIIGPHQHAIDDVGGLITSMGSLMTLPVLSLEQADIVRNEGSGAERCRIRFTLKNVGGGEAATPGMSLNFLSSGVTAVGTNSYSFAALQPHAEVRDSMEVDIVKDITHVTISALLETGGCSFIDRRTLAVPQSTTDAVDLAALPASCILHQNHPNPFRPVTTIRFTLPRAAAVMLVVTDVLGREVARLCDGERQDAGTHAVLFDARQLPAGMYLYRLESEGAVQVRKMLLMR